MATQKGGKRLKPATAVELSLQIEVGEVQTTLMVFLAAY